MKSETMAVFLVAFVAVLVFMIVAANAVAPVIARLEGLIP
jgi:hypothetical protein